MKKGPLAEALVVRCLQEHGWPYAERRVMGGARDRGDVAGIPGVVIEVKDASETLLAVFLNELADEMANDNADIGAVWHKRRGKGDPLDWYVHMTGRTFLTLLAEYTREG